jgi:hypothetical protein
MQAEQRDAEEINGNDREVEAVEAHVSCTSLARFRADRLCCVEGYLRSD